MGKLRIAARVASYLYSDGLPYDGPPIHKNLAEVYAKHAANRHKIDLTQMQKVQAPDYEDPDAQRR